MVVTDVVVDDDVAVDVVTVLVAVEVVDVSVCV